MTINKTINIDEIKRFFSQKEPVSLFLGLLALFIILWIVFGEPEAWPVLWHGVRSPLLNTTIIISAGYVLMLASRLVLRWRMQKGNPSIGWWVLVEFVCMVGVITFLTWVLSGRGKFTLGIAAGNVSLLLIGLELVPYVVAYLVFRLNEEQNEVARLRALLPQETSSNTAPQTGTIEFYDKGGKLVFVTQIENVLYIESADNYTNIHYMNEDKEDTFILHNTLKEIESRHTNRGLVRCQRGYMVNIGNVKFLRKDRMGYVLELNHTTRVIPVSKSYIDSMSNLFQSNIKTTNI